MKRTIYLILLGLIIAAIAAAQSSSIRIGTNLGPGIGPEFMVDGQRYNSTQVFVWPTGSKHVVQFLFSVNLQDDGTTITLPYQGSTAISFGGVSAVGSPP